jgi:two-component system catabolic regulation response regulator CreB
MKPAILLIEDEAAIADTLVYALGTEGFDVVWRSLGKDGLLALAAQPFALVILDVGRPDINGFELCKQIRRDSDVPLMFLTARHDEIDRVVGLEIGADDYVAKPFSPREVCARVKTILKRARPLPTPDNLPNPNNVTTQQPQKTEALPFEVDKDGGRIRFHGRLLNLTRYEFLLLQTLLSRPGRIFSRSQLMDLVWSEADAFDRTVDTHIKTLRTKLREIDPDSDPIATHRGLGYSLAVSQ